MKKTSTVISKTDFERTLTRLAYEIVERNKGAENIALVGIRTRGEFLAKRLSQKINAAEKISVDLGFLDITFYRDDLEKKSTQPVVQGTDIAFDVTGKTIILVDDVLYTGRTVRAAMDELIDHGRPAFIQLAVLIDRGLRELPIMANFVGKNVSTTTEQTIKVKMKETDGEDCVMLAAKENE